MAIEVLFTGVAVRDVATAVAWYGALFGREPDVVPHEAEAMWRVSEGGWLYVVRDAERAGHSIAALAVSDLDATLAELAGRGLHPGPAEPVGAAGRKAIATDPDGNVVSLIEVAADR